MENKEYYFTRTYNTTCTVEEKIMAKATSKEEALKKIEDSYDIPYLSTDDDITIADYKVVGINTDESCKDILEIRETKSNK